jgi:hypothetical protein
MVPAGLRTHAGLTLLACSAVVAVVALVLGLLRLAHVI